MNEDLEKLMYNIDKLAETWEEESLKGAHFLYSAKKLQYELTKLKLMIGIDRFDALPTYVRWLNETTKHIDDMANLFKKDNNNGDNK